jgi:hypothetical protein
MLYLAQMSLVNPFEPSSRAAAADGPNTLMPCAAQRICQPGHQRRFRPDHDKANAVDLAKAGDCARIVDIQHATISASLAMPALPGAQNSVSVSGDFEIAQASACSRPPEPISRIFMGAVPSRCLPWGHYLASYDAD